VSLQLFASSKLANCSSEVQDCYQRNVLSSQEINSPWASWSSRPRSSSFCPSWVKVLCRLSC